jgi:hypothetical protein
MGCPTPRCRAELQPINRPRHTRVEKPSTHRKTRYNTELSLEARYIFGIDMLQQAPQTMG